MGAFAKKIALFLLVLLLPVIFFTGFIYWKNVSIANSYRIPQSINTIVIGDSHTEKAFNPDYLATIVNFSQSSECFNYTYYKLLKILKTNPEIKNVVLGCGYHSFSVYLDEFIDGRYATEVSARYFFILPPAVQYNYMVNNSGGASQYLIDILSDGLKNMTTQNQKFTFLGSYETYQTKVRLSRETVEKRIKTHYYQDGELYGFSERNKFYLYKIQDLCYQKGIRLFLVSTPMHKLYKEKVPVKFREFFDVTIKNMNINLIDMHSLPLPDSCFLPDGDHVNARGAEITTIELAKFLDSQIRAK